MHQGPRESPQLVHILQRASTLELPGRALAIFEPGAVLKLESIGPAIVELTTSVATGGNPPSEVLLENDMARSVPSPAASSINSAIACNRCVLTAAVPCGK